MSLRQVAGVGVWGMGSEGRTLLHRCSAFALPASGETGAVHCEVRTAGMHCVLCTART